MNTIEHIRKHIFGVSQVVFAEVARTSQATISRWENGELEPDRTQMQAIRKEAVRRGIEWCDHWFFDLPANDASSSAAPAGALT